MPIRIIPLHVLQRAVFECNRPHSDYGPEIDGFGYTELYQFVALILRDKDDITPKAHRKRVACPVSEPEMQQVLSTCIALAIAQVTEQTGDRDGPRALNSRSRRS